jgi:hypothetical protein
MVPSFLEAVTKKGSGQVEILAFPSVGAVGLETLQSRSAKILNLSGLAFMKRATSVRLTRLPANNMASTVSIWTPKYRRPPEWVSM